MSVYGNFWAMSEGYGLTTASVIYSITDPRGAAQTISLVWQEYDRCPSFPLLHRFLRNWGMTVNGRVDSIVVAHAQLERQRASAEFCVN